MKEFQKVAFVVGGLGAGGQERGMSLLGNFLADQGKEVHVIVMNYSKQFYKLNDKMVIHYPTKKNASSNKYLKMISGYFYLKNQVKEIKPDVVLSWGEWYNPFVAFTLRGIKTNLFLFEKMWPTIQLSSVHEWGKRNLYKHANGVFVLTNYAAEILKKRSNAQKVFNVPVIPNFIDLDKPYTKKNQIISIGRLSKEKAQITLVEAFIKLNPKDWELHLIGDGAERASLEALVKEKNFEDKIVFQGNQKNIAKFLGEAEIFVLPSKHECFPNALVEAMSSPLACISSVYNPGVYELITNNSNGLLFEPLNSDELAQCLKKLIDNPSLRKEMSEKAYTIRKQMSKEGILHRYLEQMENNITV